MTSYHNIMKWSASLRDPGASCRRISET